MCTACEIAMMDIANYVEGKQPLPDETPKFACDAPADEPIKSPPPKAEEGKP